MLTLKYFNAVLARPTATNEPYISEQGFVIMPEAIWAKDRIINFYTEESLNGNDLNKTFHKSWKKIKESSRSELLIPQILHYLTTYGSDFTEEAYIPNEVLKVPDVKLKYKLIRGLTKEEMTEKCLDLLRSGIALKEETVDDLLSILTDELEYNFTGNEGIKNKEAIVKIADLYHVYPTNPVEFLRYIIYRTTDTSLLIKNDELIEMIRGGSYNPSVPFKEYGLDKLSQIFNRYKPLFLAYKSKCPKTINKIAKLSKTHHKPLVTNALNEVTQRTLDDGDIHWLDNATPYALFKALSACYTRMRGQNAFVYRIRNGKTWAQERDVLMGVVPINYVFILDYLKSRYSFAEKSFYMPKNVHYALPTSEKMFVGNIPTGTRFSGKKMAVGIYWENEWGANDLDLSGWNIGGKVGWNSSYNQGGGNLMFSGDITHAPNGAVEYLYANRGLSEPTLVINNVFSGSDTAEYKIIIGKGDKISKDYMMNPNNLFADIRTECVQNQMVLGIFIPEGDKQSFVVLNFGAGHARVSGYSETAEIATKALYQQWSYPLGFTEIIKTLGGKVTEDKEKADYDFSLDKLDRDSFTKIFK